MAEIISFTLSAEIMNFYLNYIHYREELLTHTQMCIQQTKSREFNRFESIIEFITVSPDIMCIICYKYIKIYYNIL